MSTPAFVRHRAQRPPWTQVLGRGLAVIVLAALTLWVLAWLLDGFDIDRPQDALLAGLVVGVVNAVVWPALAVIVVPLSVLTLGIGAIVLDAVFVAAVLDLLPGVELTGFWTALAVALGLAGVTTLVSSTLALDDDLWLDQMVLRRTRRRAGRATATDVPGFVFVQIDGLARGGARARPPLG